MAANEAVKCKWSILFTPKLVFVCVWIIGIFSWALSRIQQGFYPYIFSKNGWNDFFTKNEALIGTWLTLISPKHICITPYNSPIPVLTGTSALILVQKGWKWGFGQTRGSHWQKIGTNHSLYNNLKYKNHSNSPIPVLAGISALFRAKMAENEILAKDETMKFTRSP